MRLTETVADADANARHHPYVPTSLELPGFQPAMMSEQAILGCYGGAAALVVLVIWLTTGRVAKLRMVDRILMCWFAISGLTQTILESHYLFIPDFYTNPKPNILGEIWKEYSKADSRYIGRDPIVVGIEYFMVLVAGPGCLLAMYAIGTKAASAHSTQLLVSSLHVFATIMYSLTELIAGVQVGLPGAYYYWFYYIFCNGIWTVIPFLIICRSARAINASFASSKEKAA